MQRRPLQPTVSISFAECVNDPLATLHSILNYAHIDTPLASVSLFQYPDFATAFQSVGFDGVPVNTEHSINTDCWNPVKAPEADHPTLFLQWGARAETDNYVLFEIGDFRKIISFDFRVNKVNRPYEFVQLDQIRFESGQDVCAIKCDKQSNHTFITALQNNIAQTVRHLNNGNTEFAKMSFDNIVWPSQQIACRARLRP